MEWIYLLVLFMLFYEGLYTRRYDFWEELKNIYKALFFSTLGVLAFISIVKIGEETSRFVIFMLFFFLALLLPLARLVLKYLLYRLHVWKIPLTILTDGEQSAILKKLLDKNWYMGYKVVEKSERVLIATKDITYDSQQFIQESLSRYKEIIITPFFSGVGLLSADIHYIFGANQYFINLHNNLLLRKNLFLKALFDIVLLIFLLPFALPLLGVLYIAVVLNSKGGGFFIQPRVGKDGKTFDCIKFRTMYINNEQILTEYFELHPEKSDYFECYRKLPDDPRVTSVGKWLRKLSLDELPQIFNVLKGQMSFIGPRPYMLEEVATEDSRMRNIIKVRPGITGLWQVSGRNELTFEERLEIENWYIRNWSLWVDFVIFLRTFAALLKTRSTA